MKKLVFLLMVAALVATASAANILLVTDGYYRNTDTRYAADPTASSEGDFVAFLEGLGHTVTFGDGFQQYRDTALGSAGAQAYVTNNSIDLVVISRNTNSGNYDASATEIAGWNAIDVPMLHMSPHLGRNSRWDWSNQNSTGNSFEANITIGGVAVPWSTDGVQSYYLGSTSTPFNPATTNGTIVGTFGTYGAGIIRWHADTQMDPMSSAGAVAAAKRTMMPGLSYHETIGGITQYFDHHTPEAKALIAGEIDLLLVPEPATMVLLGLGSLMGLRRKK